MELNCPGSLPARAGDTGNVAGADGTVFARGMVFATSSQLRDAIGRQTSELPAGMTDEVIHRDDLVVL